MTHHDWILPVAIDLFIAGVGAVAFLISVMVDFTGSKKFSKVQIVGAVIAPWFPITGVFFLVHNLSKPLRFWQMIPEHKVDLSSGSPMSWGTWNLTLFIIISLIYMVVSIITKVLSRGKVVRKIVGIIGLPLAFLLILYAGILISALTGMP